MRNNFTEVVAILIKGTIYTGKEAIDKVGLTKNYDKLILWDIARFMHSKNLGEKWGVLMNSPTLFYLDQDGSPVWRIDDV